MAVVKTNTFGDLLRSCWLTRRASQLELGMEAGVSARHISFIETGRANPSQEMVIILATVLDVPLRERNLLLHAAGYAPLYSETSLDDPQMAQVRRALELILENQEPFGAVVFDRHWDVVMVNAAYVRFTSLLLGSNHIAPAPLRVISPPRPNLLHMLFDPAGWRPFITNWDVVARSLISRVHREIVLERDPATRELLSAILFRSRCDSVIKLYASSARSPPSAAHMTLPCKNCESRLFTLLMKRLRILPDPLRRASSCSVCLMKSIGAIHPNARPKVGVRVTGVASTLSTRWRSISTTSKRQPSTSM